MKAAVGKSHTACNKSQPKDIRCKQFPIPDNGQAIDPSPSFRISCLFRRFRREGLFPHVTIWWVLEDGIHMIGIDVSQPFEGLAHC